MIGQIPAQGDPLLVLPVHVRHLAAQVETSALGELQEPRDIVIMIIPRTGDRLQLQFQSLGDPVSAIDRAQLD